MSKIIWDEIGDRLFETGVKNGVLYPQVNGTYPMGYAWNGLTAVTESPSGAEATPMYADDIKYLNLYSVEELGGTIEAYTYPDQFAACDGSANLGGIAGVVIGQQTRQAFGFCYKTVLGNDEQGNDYGYKIHLIYGAKASPSEKAYATVNDSPEAITFSWEFTTTAVDVPGGKPSACIIIDSTKVDVAKLTQLENVLYGTNTTDPRLPLPAEVAEIMGGVNVNYPLTISHVNTTITDFTSSADVTGNKLIDSSKMFKVYVKPSSAAYTIANIVVIVNGVDVSSTAVTPSGEKNKLITLNAGDIKGPVTIIATANTASV